MDGRSRYRRLYDRFLSRIYDLYMAWYMPLLILTSFRPNLEDRVAVSAVSEGWYPWWKWLSRLRRKRSG